MLLAKTVILLLPSPDIKSLKKKKIELSTTPELGDT